MRDYLYTHGVFVYGNPYKHERGRTGLTLLNRRDVLLFFWYYDSTLDKFFLS